MVCDTVYDRKFLPDIKTSSIFIDTLYSLGIFCLYFEFLYLVAELETMNKILTRSFYTKPTLEVAKKLLGKYIIRRIDGKPRRKASFLRGRITEVEAYIGPQDKASHAYGGKITPCNQAEYLIGGHIYIYLVYGMYWQMNISTYKEGKPECVLIRGLDSGNITNGPGKVCRYLKLDKSFYAEDLTKSKKIWLEDRGERIKTSQIAATARIGIDYAGPYWSRRKWRFVLKK